MLFLFFFILSEWGGWVLKSMENSVFFIFFILEGNPAVRPRTQMKSLSADQGTLSMSHESSTARVNQVSSYLSPRGRSPSRFNNTEEMTEKTLKIDFNPKELWHSMSICTNNFT